MRMQRLQKEYDRLQLIHGEQSLNSIYGAGCSNHPKAMLVFMNPTGRNISSLPEWPGIRAPWLGTRNIWPMFHDLGLLPKNYMGTIQRLKAEEWTAEFASELYEELAKRKIFVTNLAKCTQADARPLPDKVYLEYLDLMFEEISAIRPKNIITFGNQVSSILLSKRVSVSSYTDTQKDALDIGKHSYDVYPVFYPVGQGRRNMPLAIKRIRAIL
jgi:uracil-DNA glycosylase